jgi:hypothetical protein
MASCGGWTWTIWGIDTVVWMIKQRNEGAKPSSNGTSDREDGSGQQLRCLRRLVAGFEGVPGRRLL